MNGGSKRAILKSSGLVYANWRFIRRAGRPGSTAGGMPAATKLSKLTFLQLLPSGKAHKIFLKNLLTISAFGTQ